MELKFNVTGPDRKRLAAAISEFTQCRAEYQYMPTCAYVIGSFTLSKEGTLICEESEVPTSLASSSGSVSSERSTRRNGRYCCGT